MKGFLKGLLILSIIAILLASTGGALYWYNWQANEPATAEVSTSSVEAKVGAPIAISLVIKTPWYRSIEEPVTLVTSGKAALSGVVEKKNSSMSFSGYSWELKLEVLLFEPGSYKDLQLMVPLSSDREKKQKTLIVSLPELQASLRNIGKDGIIELKSTLTESALNPEIIDVKEKSSLWIWLLIVAVIIAITAFFLKRKSRQKNVKVLPAWELAQLALDNLKKDHSLNDDTFFVGLSDILRVYIEKRFSLQATESTSEEFIQEIRRDSLLTENQQISLESFLSTADLVKFAKMSADQEQRSECLQMADSFVKETIPKQEAVL